MLTIAPSRNLAVSTTILERLGTPSNSFTVLFAEIKLKKSNMTKKAEKKKPSKKNQMKTKKVLDEAYLEKKKVQAQRALDYMQNKDELLYARDKAKNQFEIEPADPRFDIMERFFEFDFSGREDKDRDPFQNLVEDIFIKSLEINRYHVAVWTRVYRLVANAEFDAAIAYAVLNKEDELTQCLQDVIKQYDIKEMFPCFE